MNPKSAYVEETLAQNWILALQELRVQPFYIRIFHFLDIQRSTDIPGGLNIKEQLTGSRVLLITVLKMHQCPTSHIHDESGWEVAGSDSAEAWKTPFSRPLFY